MAGLALCSFGLRRIRRADLFQFQMTVRRSQIDAAAHELHVSGGLHHRDVSAMTEYVGQLAVTRRTMDDDTYECRKVGGKFGEHTDQYFDAAFLSLASAMTSEARCGY